MRDASSINLFPPHSFSFIASLDVKDSLRIDSLSLEGFFDSTSLIQLSLASRFRCSRLACTCGRGTRDQGSVARVFAY